MRTKRLTLAFVAAMVSSAVAVQAAPTTSAPIVADDIVVTTSAALSVANAPGYALSYSHDGTASYDGPLNGLDGHYEAKIDFASVQTVISEAGLCERSGIPKFIEAPAFENVRGSTAAPKRFVVVQLRCETGPQPLGYKTFNDKYTPELSSVADTLLKLGAGLDWRYVGTARRELGVRFIH